MKQVLKAMGRNTDTVTCQEHFFCRHVQSHELPDCHNTVIIWTAENTQNNKCKIKVDASIVHQFYVNKRTCNNKKNVVPNAILMV